MNKRQRRKIRQKTNLRLLFFTFLGAFILFFLGFTYLLPVVTPKVEIPVLSEDHVIDSITSQDFRGRIDPRLRSIELQEELVYEEIKSDFKNSTAKIELSADESAQEEISADENANPILLNEEIIVNIPPRPQPLQIREEFNLSAPVPIFDAKVVVGDFSNPREAILASDILISLNFEPFIRKRNGKYILQIASFSDVKKAATLVQELKNRNFDAKIIYE